MRHLYLASASAQRCNLLAQLGLPFKVIKPNIVEVTPLGGIGRPIAPIIRANALNKAQTVASQLEEGIVISGDTIVITKQGQPLGKPRTYDEALEMLRLLVGTWHRVLSAVAVVDAKTARYHTSLATTHVWFRNVSDLILQQYVKTEEPIGKAGAYAIQGRGGFFVTRLNGSYSNVVGLPLEILIQLLREFDVQVSSYW